MNSEVGGAFQEAGRQFSLQNIVAARVLFDAFAIVSGGFLVSWALEAAGVSAAQDNLRQERSLIILFALCLFLLFARLLRAYTAHRILDGAYAATRLAWALLLTFSVLLAVGAALKTTQDHSRLWFFSWAALSSGCVLAAHGVALRRVRKALAGGACIHRAIAVGVGCPPLSVEAIAAQTGNEVRALASFRVDDADLLGQVAERAKQHAIDKIYVTAAWQDIPQLVTRLGALRKVAANVHVLPRDEQVQLAQLRAGAFGEELALLAASRPLQGWRQWQKRALDVAVAGVALVLAGPVMIVVAVAIKLESRGPILFKQKRAGFNGAAFECWKFRSMHWERRDAGASQQTQENDPRVTRVGRFIRKTSLDELPQFFNVMQGHMSVVGPRPHALATSAEGRLLNDVLDDYAARHRVKPGLTGWAQVNGLRGPLTSAEKLRKRVAYDLEYIEKWSPWLDLRIILRTVLIVFHDRAAF